MFDINFRNFFDREYVAAQIDSGVRRSLSRLGAFVRRTARSSIRDRKGTAKPGSPPSSHTGLLKEFIYFFYDSETKSVVIGPAFLNAKRRGGKPATELLEFGGETINWRTKKPAVYHAFPFMRPAMEKNITKFPEFFANMLGGQ